VSAWVDKSRNYNNYTTNRVESQHARLKKDLNEATNCTLDKFVPCIDDIVESQKTAMSYSFTRSKIYQMNDHNVPVLAELRLHMSHAGLDLLAGEVKRIEKLLKFNRVCACNVWTSCGLPCSCILQGYILGGD
jgi:hypothetical protein